MNINKVAFYSKRGQVYLYIAFVGIVLLALALSWVYLKDQVAYGGLNIPFLDRFQPQASFNTAGWKEFKPTDDLVLLYPPDWLIVEEKYIAQYSFTPGKISNDVYNAINVLPITVQIQTSYANEDWFNGLYSAKKDVIVVNQYRPNDQNLGRYKKIESGKTLKGDSYVIFQDLKTMQQLNAYLLRDRTKIYFFTLDHYDQTGQDFFRKILSTAKPI